MPTCSACTSVTDVSRSILEPTGSGSSRDARYGDLIELARHAIARVRTGRGSVGATRRQGCVEVWSYWQHWRCLFPQHGKGRKHDRRITLETWQRDIVRRYPRQLLRGLIHSDGCRTTNRVQHRAYSYVRYFFSNRSSDILQIFRDACDDAGIVYRDSRWDTVSVARREAVAALDRFIGPKS
jgi:hypothetical protein